MTIPRGLGVFIWQLKYLHPIDETIKKMKSIGIKWVSIKFRDGMYRYNRVDTAGNFTGKDDYLMMVVNKFKDAGIEVGAWQFIYTSHMETQARVQVEDIKTFGLSHLLVDAEHFSNLGALWKTAGSDRLAKVYMDALTLPAGFPIALCSYRFPKYHMEFPFKAFINHYRHNFHAPQVYWAGATNSGQQLRVSYDEYMRFRPQPFVPMGAAYSEWGWAPTPGQIEEFVKTAKTMGMPGWGFWEWSWAAKRPEWLDAMKDDSVAVPTPDPTPEPTPEPTPDPVPVGTVKEYKVNSQAGLRVRSSIIPSRKYGATPGTRYEYSKIYFLLGNGETVGALEEIKDGPNIWVRTGLRQFVAKLYDDVNYLV